MTETSQKAQDGVAGAVHGLSDNAGMLVRAEIRNLVKETAAQAKDQLPSVGLIGAAVLLGLFTVASSYRLALRMLEAKLSPALAAVTATAGFAAGGAAAAALASQRLGTSPGQLAPAKAASAAAGKARQAASSTAGKARQTAGNARQAAGRA